MATASVKATIDAPIDQIWATVGNFDALPNLLPQLWDDSVTEGCGVGSIRTVTNQNGIDVVERLEALDGTGRTRSVSFSILGGNFVQQLPFDPASYSTTMQVHDLGNGQTEFTWSATYEVKAGISEADAEAALEGIFSTAAENLRTIYEPPPLPDQGQDLPPLCRGDSPQAIVTAVIDAPLDAVWATVGNFDALPHMLPLLWDNSKVQGSGIGAVRTLTNDNGTDVIERLESYDAKGAVRSVNFSILGGNFVEQLPFKQDSYLGTMQVRDLGNGKTEFTWAATYEVKPEISAADAKAALEGLFASGVAGLRTLHEVSRLDCDRDGDGCGTAIEDDLVAGGRHCNNSAPAESHPFLSSEAVIGRAGQFLCSNLDAMTDLICPSEPMQIKGTLVDCITVKPETVLANLCSGRP